MAVGDRFKAAANRGRVVADRLGQRPTTVSIVLETWSAPINTAGATLLSAPQTVLSPTPKVTFQGDMASVFGDGTFSGPDVSLDSPIVQIGPITPRYPGGGYDASDLEPAQADATQRTYVLLTGRGFSAGGERYEITKVDDSRPNGIFLTARRTAQS